MLDVEILHFDGGSEPVKWQYSAASMEAAFFLLGEEARNPSFTKLVLIVNGRTHGVVYRCSATVEIITSREEEVIDF